MHNEWTVLWAAGVVALLAASAALSVLLIVLLRPLLERYAPAQPNARSSHKTPTPQGGGIPVITATIAISGVALYVAPAAAAAAPQLPIILAAVVLIAGVGVLADIHRENVALRLLLQTLAVAAVIFVLPSALRAMPILPLPVERIALVVGGLWFVNLVNFMDGLDWMTVAEVVPLTATLAANRLVWPATARGNYCKPGALRRYDRLCLFQSAGCQAFSRRRRQPADRAFARLAASFARWQWRPRCGNPVAVILSRRFHHYAHPPRGKWRDDLATASLAFLSARHRPRLFRARRSGARFRPESWTLFIGNHNYLFSG